MNLADYDPNNRWGTHTIELHLMQWDWELRVTTTIGGNCKGFSILESAIDRYADQLFDEQGENPEIALLKPDDKEDRLLSSPDGDPIESWLRSMCVGVRIVSFEPEATPA